MQQIKPNPACSSAANVLEELTEQAGGGTQHVNVLVARRTTQGAVECYTFLNHGTTGSVQYWTVDGPATSLVFETTEGSIEGSTATLAETEELVKLLLVEADWFGSAVPYYTE